MSKEITFLIEELPEGGFTAKALDYSIYTEAETFEETKQSIIDAVRCHFEKCDMPNIIRFRLVKEEVIIL